MYDVAFGTPSYLCELFTHAVSGNPLTEINMIPKNTGKNSFFIFPPPIRSVFSPRPFKNHRDALTVGDAHRYETKA